MTLPIFDQDAFVRVFDDGDLDNSTFGTTNGDWTQDTDTVFRVRFVIQETNNKSSTNETLNLYYNLNGAGYAAVTGSTPIQSAASADTSWTITDGDAITTQRLGAGTFVNGEYSEDGTTSTVDFAGNDETEIEFCLTIDSGQVSDANTITLQVYDGTSPIGIYTNTPTVTVNEPAVGTLTISVSDTIAIQDILPSYFIDTIFISDNATVTLVNLISVLDTIALSDNVNLSVLDVGAVTISVTDTIALSDAATVEVETDIAVTDTVAISDAPTVLIPDLYISVSDTIAISDNVSVSTTEAGAVVITVSDTIAISDNVLVDLSDPQISVSDTISLSDNVTVSIEAIAALAITVSDTIALSDTPIARTEIYIVATDTVAISDNVSLLVPQLYISTSDTIAISDSPSLAITPLFISVSDSIAVSDTVTVSVPAAIIAMVFLTVAARSTNLTLSNRSLTLTLEDR